MNAVVQFDASVPAFLRNAGFLALNEKAAAGLSTGSPPRISFRGSRFRFVAADGTETPVTEGNGTQLSVIVVDASAHVSKFYYDKAYDPNADDQAPACFSDNGVGPSVRANKPQALHCAGCPKNAWGSKVTPQGSQVKACSDLKKIAVIPVDNMAGPAYVLAVPAASLKTWTAAVKALSDRGIPVPALVVQLGFDGTAEYPKLTFSPTRWINEQENAVLQELFGSEEVAELTGANDKPIQSLPHGQIAAEPAPMQLPQGAPPAFIQQPAQQFQPPVQQPVVQQPFVPPAVQPAPAFLQPQPPAAAPVPAAPAPAPRRRRNAAAAPAAAEVSPAPMTPAPALPRAAAPPSDINALLDQVMGPPK